MKPLRNDDLPVCHIEQTAQVRRCYCRARPGSTGFQVVRLQNGNPTLGVPITGSNQQKLLPLVESGHREVFHDRRVAATPCVGTDERRWP